MNAGAPETVDDYIAAAPQGARAMATAVREIIRQAAPKAEEKLSYGMPYYGYHGRLIYFSARSDYIGLYVMSARDQLATEIEPYRTAKATLHFAIDKPLPAELIRKIITIQMALNEEKAARSS